MRACLDTSVRGSRRHSGAFPPCCAASLHDCVSFYPSQSWSQALRPAHLLCVRRTPRACHGACDHLRPGRLRASHAVCLGYSTLEPVLCARKESDNERVSTTERIIDEPFTVRSVNQSFRTDSLRSSSASPIRIPATLPRGFRTEPTANNALQRTAPRVTLAAPRRPTAQPARRAPQSLSLGSLGIIASAHHHHAATKKEITNERHHAYLFCLWTAYLD